jgi:O-antigen/teichoic acid export membrane protein
VNVKEFIRNKQFLSFAGNIIMSVLNILTNAVLYRHMEKDELGVWFVFIVTFTFIDTFRTGFLQTAFIKFFAGAQKERAENILGSTWYVGFLTTGIVCLLTLPGYFLFGNTLHDKSISVILGWTGVSFISTLPIVIATWILQAEQRYGPILYIRLVNQGVLISIIGWCIYSHQLTLTSLLIANLTTNVITSAIAFACGWTRLHTIFKQTTASVKEIYHFGKFSVGTSISSNLLRSSDTYIINFTLGPGAVAVYNIAQSLMNIIEIPLRSFVATAMTSLSAAQNNNYKEEVEKILKKYAGTLTILFIPVVIGAIAFADVGVGLLGGGKWVGTPAANVFRIFMIFAIFFPIDRFTGVTLDVIHQPRINFYKVLTMLVINVAGDFAGIYFLHNLYGVAIASIPTFVIGTLFGYLSLKHFLNFNLSQILRVGLAESIMMIKGVLRKLPGRLVK